MGFWGFRAWGWASSFTFPGWVQGSGFEAVGLRCDLSLRATVPGPGTIIDTQVYEGSKVLGFGFGILAFGAGLPKVGSYQSRLTGFKAGVNSRPNSPVKRQPLLFAVP